MTRLEEIITEIRDLEKAGLLTYGIAWSYVLEAYGLGRDGEPGPSQMEIELAKQIRP